MRLFHACGECRANIDTPACGSQNATLANHWDECDAAVARGIRYTQKLTHTNKGEDQAKLAEARIAARV